MAGETTLANPYPYAANDPLNMVDPLGLRPLSDRDLALKIGFAGTLTATDPWLAAHFEKLFDLYNKNHTEAVTLVVRRIMEVMPRAKLSVETYVNGLYPDIVAEVDGQLFFWEVKPNTPYGTKTGLAQLANYGLALARAGGRPGPRLAP